MRLFALVLLTLCSCTDTPPPYQAPGTARMAERLATLVDHVNPADNIYLST